jgi:5-formyltetrahydrofolate cyclo-ligase
MSIYPREIGPLRKLILQKRKLLPASIRAQYFSTIIASFLELAEYKNAQHILAYYGKTASGEFNTVPLLNRILENKNLYLPKCAPDGVHLELYEIFDVVSDVRLGAYDIMEPREDLGTSTSLALIDLVIVPGSVFDVWGSRYGYGAGFYDTLLAKFQKPKIAFAPDFSVMSFHLKTHPKDIPMNMIITETRIHNSCLKKRE